MGYSTCGTCLGLYCLLELLDGKGAIYCHGGYICKCTGGTGDARRARVSCVTCGTCGTRIPNERKDGARETRRNGGTRQLLLGDQIIVGLADVSRGADHPAADRTGIVDGGDGGTDVDEGRRKALLGVGDAVLIGAERRIGPRGTGDVECARSHVDFLPRETRRAERLRVACSGLDVSLNDDIGARRRERRLSDVE